MSKLINKDENIVKLQVTGYFTPSTIQLSHDEIRDEIDVVSELPIGKTTFDKAMKCLKEENIFILTDGRNFYIPATVGTKKKRKVLLVVTHKKLKI